MFKGLYLLLFLSVFEISEQRNYSKIHYPNGKLKSEGWIENNQKTAYWFYYFENGNKKEEGHYETNKKTKWWIFYNSKGKITQKSEFKNDKLDGLSITYIEGKISKAEKYKLGNKEKEWNNLDDYLKDK